MDNILRVARKLFFNFLYYVACRVVFQKMLGNVHLFSLFGMGFVKSGNLKNSGELAAIAHVFKNLASTPEVVIFDVGANVGNYTLAVLKLLGKRGALVYSFEPSKSAFAKLQDNIKDVKNVFLHNTALGAESKNATLFYDKEASGFASFYQRRLDHFNIHMNLNETVSVTTIDDFCRQHNIKKVHFLKMDVEGYELNVLQGASHMIENKLIDFIQFEFGGCNIDSRTFFQDFYYLLSPRYRLYRVVRDGLYPIGRYEETQEIFMGANFLAELIKK